ncbi:MAG: efflux RND transporter periplasmic adaptor subunit [Dysgonamonadaceae bacterium]|jgi:RND family efflux transporter MFP subunit|nr:efflux RND transporter periplasmic adaptor subunit [Dysgonamonadaceae bacterium]
MKLKTYISVAICIALTGCAHNHTHESDNHGHSHDLHHEASEAGIEAGNTTIFTHEQQGKINFAVEEVLPQAFGPIIRTTAQIQPAQSDERIVTAKTEGTVLFLGDNTVEGKAVGAGQALFVVDGSGAADNNLSVRYAEAESDYKRTKAEYERKQALAKDNIVSQSELLKSRTDFANAEAVYNNLKRNFPAGKQTAGSPVGGFITRVLARNGQYVEAGQPVLVVSQNRDLFIKAELQTKYFDVLGSVKSAHIRIPDNNRTYTLEELNGRMVSYGRSTDINHPLVPVIFRVNYSEGLLPGRFVELFIKTQTGAQTLTVSNEAIVEEMGNYFVYVQQSPERFEKRSIEKGDTDGLRTEIRKGVSNGETIVSQGAIFIKLAQAAGAVDVHSGHVH